MRWSLSAKGKVSVQGVPEKECLRGGSSGRRANDAMDVEALKRPPPPPHTVEGWRRP